MPSSSSGEEARCSSELEQQLQSQPGNWDFSVEKAQRTVGPPRFSRLEIQVYPSCNWGSEVFYSKFYLQDVKHLLFWLFSMCLTKTSSLFAVLSAVFCFHPQELFFHFLWTNHIISQSHERFECAGLTSCIGQMSPKPETIFTYFCQDQNSIHSFLTQVNLNNVNMSVFISYQTAVFFPFKLQWINKEKPSIKAGDSAKKMGQPTQLCDQALILILVIFQILL